MTKKGWHKDTLSIRGGLTRSGFDETSEALFLNSGFVYANAEEAEAAFRGDIDRYVYGRFGNPTTTMLEQRLAALEGAEAAIITATGMAAMFAMAASVLKAGGRIVASRGLFGACYAVIDAILPQWGIEREFVDGTNLDEWRHALKKPAQMVFIESPSNPLLDLVDIGAVAKIAHGAGALVVVDNVFATQSGQSPLELGADVVMYSLTKNHDGHGRVMGGALLGSDDLINGDVSKFLRLTGASISPFNAWVILKSLETMNLRVERQGATAKKIADTLSEHPKLAELRYPHHPNHPQYDLACKQMKHGGSMVMLDLKGGKQAAFKMLNALELVDISNNLGDAKTLACHPETTTHSSLSDEIRQKMGIKSGMIRLSVGLEHGDDVISDLTQALNQA